MNLLTKDTYVNHNLGKKLLFLLSFTLLQAEDFSYTFHVDNKNPYVKEAVLLTLDLNQTNHNIVLLFDFDLAPSDNYSFQRLDIKETDSYHNAKIHYVYLVYPLVSGDVKLQFTLTQKATTDESVAYSFSGDRDNVKGLVTTNIKIILPPLVLPTKILPKGTKLVGDFTLDYTLKKQQAKAYEPLPLQVTIQGLGYPPLMNTLLPKEGNFTRFTEKPIVHSVASTLGTQSTITYPMALSHSESFTLDTLHIKAFNPKTEKSYQLTIPSLDFDITKIEQAHLLDKSNMPEALTTKWSWVEELGTLLKYLIVFMAGYLSALTFKWGKSKQTRQDNPLKTKIQNAKDERALLQILMSTDSKRFKTSIEKLEASLYAHGKINFRQVKQEAEEQI